MTKESQGSPKTHPPPRVLLITAWVPKVSRCGPVLGVQKQEEVAQVLTHGFDSKAKYFQSRSHLCHPPPTMVGYPQHPRMFLLHSVFWSSDPIGSLGSVQRTLPGLPSKQHPSNCLGQVCVSKVSLEAWLCLCTRADVSSTPRAALSVPLERPWPLPSSVTAGNPFGLFLSIWFQPKLDPNQI